MVTISQKNKISEFVEYWKKRGYEKGESQKFWLSLLHDVFGIEHAEQYIDFEDKVYLDHTSFIDGMIPSTKVMIEQKAAGKDLRKGTRQSDGIYRTAFQQAKRYITELPLSRHPRWIVTCNFREFWVYDMEKPLDEPEVILLENLEQEYYRLSFLVSEEKVHIQKEKEISIQAGEIVGFIYDALLKQYTHPERSETLESLNILCVRIVFCLYAEDAGIFGRHMMFHDYMSQFDVNNWRSALIELFKVLNTKEEERSEYLSDDLSEFPYVNGGLFADENIEIPKITDEIVYMIITLGSEGFDWSGISPTIFGAVFESTLNPETRRRGGMHYTSIENIHKTIDPLFLDELREEFGCIIKHKYSKVVERKLKDFQKKISELKFLDPACGSGNFLTESYISLRRLENKVIKKLMAIKNTEGQLQLGDFDITNPIKVSINQFYGIEINDFAVTVARTALWIAEHQMMKETEDIVHSNLNFLPLKTYVNIKEGNALRIDWENVVSKEKVSYIMGNPPFVGTGYLSENQREDMDMVWKGEKRGKLDYVTCWYVKAADYMGNNSGIRCAFVSTNSICQGEQASSLWKKMLFVKKKEILFAVRSFVWDNEASKQAKVHVVIVGFSNPNNEKKKIIEGKKEVIANNINGYLLDAPTVIVEESEKPICDVPAIVRGSQATDNGMFLFSAEEKEEFLKKEPGAEKYFKRFMMGREFINNIERWCLWMPDITPYELKKYPYILNRVKAVQEFRLNSENDQTRKAAQIPWRFGQYRSPAKQYIAFAKVSSQRRRYMPFGFLTDEVIPGDKLFTIPGASLYHFGVLTSSVHMAWMRTVGGRMKSDYSYSTTIVYNNFVWCKPTNLQKQKIELAAQDILNARALYSESSLADLYDEVTMPIELRKAHQKNDFAVLEAYGFKNDMTDSDCVSELLKQYMCKRKV